MLNEKNYGVTVYGGLNGIIYYSFLKREVIVTAASKKPALANRHRLSIYSSTTFNRIRDKPLYKN